MKTHQYEIISKRLKPVRCFPCNQHLDTCSSFYVHSRELPNMIISISREQKTLPYVKSLFRAHTLDHLFFVHVYAIWLMMGYCNHHSKLF